MAQRSPRLSRRRSTVRTRRGSCPRSCRLPAASRAPAPSTAWRSSRSSSRPRACPTCTKATSCGICISSIRTTASRSTSRRDGRRWHRCSRRSSLAARQAPSTGGALARHSSIELLDAWPDGRIKLWLTARLLRLRQNDPQLFLHGSYVPLHVEGPRWARVVAYAAVPRRPWPHHDRASPGRKSCRRRARMADHGRRVAGHRRAHS